MAQFAEHLLLVVQAVQAKAFLDLLCSHLEGEALYLVLSISVCLNIGFLLALIQMSHSVKRNSYDTTEAREGEGKEAVLKKYNGKWYWTMKLSTESLSLGKKKSKRAGLTPLLVRPFWKIQTSLFVNKS